MSRRPYGYERGGRSHGQRNRPHPYEWESGHGGDRMNGTSRQDGDDNYEYENRNRSPNMRVHNDRSRWSPLPKDYNRMRQRSANEHGEGGRLDHREQQFHGRNRSPQDRELWLRRSDSGRSRASPSREINQGMNYPGRTRSSPNRDFNQGVIYPGRRQSSPNKEFNQGMNYRGRSRSPPNRQFNQGSGYRGRSRSPSNRQFNQGSGYRGRSRSSSNRQFNQGMDYRGRSRSPSNREFNQGMDYRGRSRSPSNREFNLGMDYRERSRLPPNREFDQGMNYPGRSSSQNGELNEGMDYPEKSRSPPNQEFNRGMNYSGRSRSPPNRGFSEDMNYAGWSSSSQNRGFNEGMNYPGGSWSPSKREFNEGMDFRLQSGESPKNLGCNLNGSQKNENIVPSRTSEIAKNNTRIFQIPSLDEDTKITLVLLNHILYTVFAKTKVELEHANVLTDNFLEHRNAVKLMKYEVRKLVDELPAKKTPQQKREWTHADVKRIKMAKLQTSKTRAIEALKKLFEDSSLESGKTEKLVEECLDVLLEENFPEDLKPGLEDYAKDSEETLCEATVKEDFQWQYVVAAYQMIGFKLVNETPSADERGRLIKLHLENGALAAVLVESIRLFQCKGKKVKPGDNVVLTGQVAKLVKHAKHLTYLRNSECIQIYNNLMSKGIKYETEIMSVLPRDADLETTTVLHFTNLVLYFDQAMTVLQYRMVQRTPCIPLSHRVKMELFDLTVHTVYKEALKILRNGITLASRKMD